MFTPWGKADTVEEIAPGIVAVTTPGHGGYKLDPDRIEAMPQYLHEAACYTPRGWFEEDCEWALVVAFFAREFPAKTVKAARETIKQYYPEVAKKMKRGG